MFLLIEGIQGLIDSFFERFSYIGPFVVLLLCGIGLPLPEEVTLIGSGLLLHRGEVEFLPMVGVCCAAILLGDSIPFWLGRWRGDALLQKRWVRRLLHPQRLRSLRVRFADHGDWAIFTCRFLPGVRIPGYFTAGTLGMPFLRFFVLDALGVALSVPVSIYLGKLFGESVEHLKKRMDHLHLLLAFILVSVVLIVVVRARSQARLRRDLAREAAASASAAPDSFAIRSLPGAAAAVSRSTSARTAATSPTRSAIRR